MPDNSLFLTSLEQAMNIKYDPQQIEEKWQKKWAEKRLLKSRKTPKKKNTSFSWKCFPTLPARFIWAHVSQSVYHRFDVVARYKTHEGFKCFTSHGMGFPSACLRKIAAIEHKIHPSQWTNENIAHMKKQLKRMGFSYDWDRELSTCEPVYYRWEQLFFLWMYEKGLAYKKRSIVNYCTKCDTVLANEQVEAGLCWRCGTEVGEKVLEQWFFKITAYIEELLDYCDKLPGWPERVLTMQRNWIGKSYGCEVSFPLVGSDEVIKVFTTRPDTLFGATFMLVAAEHPLVTSLSKGKP